MTWIGRHIFFNLFVSGKFCRDGTLDLQGWNFSSAGMEL
jgi:hypothetical protein